MGRVIIGLNEAKFYRTIFVFLGRADVGEPDSKRPRLMGMAMGGPPGMMYPAIMPGMAPPPMMQPGMPPQVMPGMAPPMMMMQPPRVQ